MLEQEFDAYFRNAAGAAGDQAPFPYQTRLAIEADWPAQISIPTGLGKTLAVVVAWLWRRRAESPVRAKTPRRLVYCLPMRVLVEQTRDVVVGVLERLHSDVPVVLLMGGADEGASWDTYPERDTIVIGTQDMLLSRALNRGYGMSRYRWPLHFGLLNTDCLWVIDEVQLVGTGVATSAQLQALRRKLGTVRPTQTSWMSATLEERWVRTVDVEDSDVRGVLALEPADHVHPVVARRVGAHKRASPAEADMGDTKALASEIAARHRAGTRTLAIVNTVDRACLLFSHLRKAAPNAVLSLLHSRYRRGERDLALAGALAPPNEAGTIVVSTQVIEAGVDLSSATLFTELAPWSSLVQRFGRCNRRGEDAEARVFWIRLPADPRTHAKLDKPYTLSDLVDAQDTLAGLTDVGPAALPCKALTMERGLVLRRRDLLDLFDTTPDLAGNDVDVSRFIRDSDDHDVRVCWRAIDKAPAADDPPPIRAELCNAPIGVVREWQAAKPPRQMWAWNPLGGGWNSAPRLMPGLTLLLRAEDGGYDNVLGLVPKDKTPVEPVVASEPAHDLDRENDGDPLSEWNRWYTLTEHSNDVAREALAIATAMELPADLHEAATTAARWHDAGKAHRVWQDAARRLGSDPPVEFVAKSNAEGKRITYARRGFRHELASALLALAHGQSDLVCYLIACHHGKVRLSIRSLPTEAVPRDPAGRVDPTIRYARGVWEGDQMPAIDLGDSVLVPPTQLTLRYMELGDDPVTGASWLARMLTLRDDVALGPFRLGFLEAIVKSADERASARARERR
jgi:CRISPR-associated endonuclease/helicase Cas3